MVVKYLQIYKLFQTNIYFHASGQVDLRHDVRSLMVMSPNRGFHSDIHTKTVCVNITINTAIGPVTHL